MGIKLNSITLSDSITGIKINGVLCAGMKLNGETIWREPSNSINIESVSGYVAHWDKTPDAENNYPDLSTTKSRVWQAGRVLQPARRITQEAVRISAISTHTIDLTGASEFTFEFNLRKLSGDNNIIFGGSHSQAIYLNVATSFQSWIKNVNRAVGGLTYSNDIHVSYQISTTDISVYVDNVLVGTASRTDSYTFGSFPYMILSASSYSAGFNNGSICDAVAKKDGVIIHHWPLSESSGSMIYDIVGDHHFDLNNINLREEWINGYSVNELGYSGSDVIPANESGTLAADGTTLVYAGKAKLNFPEVSNGLINFPDHVPEIGLKADNSILDVAYNSDGTGKVYDSSVQGWYIGDDRSALYIYNDGFSLYESEPINTDKKILETEFPTSSYFEYSSNKQMPYYPLNNEVSEHTIDIIFEGSMDLSTVLDNNLRLFGFNSTNGTNYEGRTSGHASLWDYIPLSGGGYGISINKADTDVQTINRATFSIKQDGSNTICTIWINGIQKYTETAVGHTLSTPDEVELGWWRTAATEHLTVGIKVREWRLYSTARTPSEIDTDQSIDLYILAQAKVNELQHIAYDYSGNNRHGLCDGEVKRGQTDFALPNLKMYAESAGIVVVTLANNSSPNFYWLHNGTQVNVNSNFNQVCAINDSIELVIIEPDSFWSFDITGANKDLYIDISYWKTSQTLAYFTMKNLPKLFGDIGTVAFSPFMYNVDFSDTKISGKFTDVDWTSSTQARNINISNTDIGGDITNYAPDTGITDLDFSFSNVYGDVSGWDLPSGLLTLNFEGTSVTGCDSLTHDTATITCP